ncbi:MAG: hypothetical protein WC415_06115 [Patescibacteria group bacterium]|jgi:hypothetical protein
MQDKPLKKIELGLPEFEAEDILKQQILDNILSIHRALTEMDGSYSPKVPFLVDCLITAITPYEQQLATFDLKEELIEKQTKGITDLEIKNRIIMETNIKILGVCRVVLSKYTEKRLAIIR